MSQFRRNVSHTKSTNNGVNILDINDAEAKSDFSTLGNRNPINYVKLAENCLKQFPEVVNALIWCVFTPVSAGISQMTMLKIPVKADGRISKVNIFLRSSEDDVMKPESWTLERLYIAFRRDLADALKTMSLIPPLAGAAGFRDKDLLALCPKDIQYLYHRGYPKWALVNAQAGGDDWEEHLMMAFLDMKIQDEYAAENEADEDWLSSFVAQANARGLGDAISPENVQKWADKRGNRIYSRWVDLRRNRKGRRFADVSGYADIFRETAEEDEMPLSAGEADRLIKSIKKWNDQDDLTKDLIKKKLLEDIVSVDGHYKKLPGTPTGYKSVSYDSFIGKAVK